MALLPAPPLVYRHHYCRFPIHSNRANSLQSPKASVSLASPSIAHLTLPEKITYLCESRNFNQALHLLEQHSTNSSDNTRQTAEATVILLQACGRCKEIEIGQKVHRIISTHFHNDSVINTSLITMYSMCGLPFESRAVFDGLEVNNLVLWNATISGYTRNELYFDAILVFCELISVTELTPDIFTLPCVIKACAECSEVGFGKTIHGFAIKLGLVSNVFVGNAIIAMYGEFGFVEEAVNVFDGIPQRNLVSWNSLIRVYSENGFVKESFDVLMHILAGEQGLTPDVATMVTMLKMCGSEGYVIIGTVVHGMAVKLGMILELNLYNALMHMYATCGLSFEAQFLFERNEKKNGVSWNAMIGNYSRDGNSDKAFCLLRKMQKEVGKAMVNGVTILNVLPACHEKAQLLNLKELHAYSIKHGFIYDELVYNSFISAYAKCGCLSYADNAFHLTEVKTVNSWNALIGGYAQNGDPRTALNLYIQMTSASLAPNLFSIGSVLLACAKLKRLQLGKQIHGFLLRTGLIADSFVCVSLLSLYIQCHRVHLARALFDWTGDKSLVFWNAMIAGYSKSELPGKAIDIFREMLSSNIQPYEIALVSLLGACSELTALWLGREAHCFALKTSLIDDQFVACSIIDMYAKCGSIEQSWRVFQCLKVRNVGLYNAMIGGFGSHGRGVESKMLFDEMRILGLWPDDLTFIALLTACSHAGLVEEGLDLFQQMHRFYGIEPKVEHYACVIDMLGRAGSLSEALELVDLMPMEPDAKIWSSLANSCRTHGELNLGIEVAEKLLEVEPERTDNYVLLSNLLAREGKWERVRNVRGKMKDMGLQKDAGCSWIEVGGKFYKFTSGGFPTAIKDSEIMG